MSKSVYAIPPPFSLSQDPSLSRRTQQTQLHKHLTLFIYANSTHPPLCDIRRIEAGHPLSPEQKGNFIESCKVKIFVSVFSSCSCSATSYDDRSCGMDFLCSVRNR